MPKIKRHVEQKFGAQTITPLLQAEAPGVTLENEISALAEPLGEFYEVDFPRTSRFGVKGFQVDVIVTPLYEEITP